MNIVEQILPITSKGEGIRSSSNLSCDNAYDYNDDELPEEMNPYYVRPRETIKAAEEEICDRIWFSRNTKFIRNDKGECVLVPLFPASAPAVEELLKKYGGYEALLPANEFESDMLHGKLSALRWVLGWEWDFLDT